MAAKRNKPVKKNADENPWPAKLAALQERLQLTNEGMAQHFDVSIHTYMAWKYGRRIPSRMALRAIADKLE